MSNVSPNTHDNVQEILSLVCLGLENGRARLPQDVTAQLMTIFGAMLYRQLKGHAAARELLCHLHQLVMEDEPHALH